MERKSPDVSFACMLHESLHVCHVCIDEGTEGLRGTRELGMVGHAYSPRTQRSKVVRLFKASLGFGATPCPKEGKETKKAEASLKW